MIEFTHPVERVRRVSHFARSDGATQWNVVEASVFGWTDGWMVMPIQGEDVALIDLLYPSWLPHMCRAFCVAHPEAAYSTPEGLYVRAREKTKVVVFRDADDMAEELDWKPSDDILADGSSWVASYCPAGRVTLCPWAFAFTKSEEQRDRNSLWLPMERGTDDFRVFFQSGLPHMESPLWSERDWRKSQYQACVITDTRRLDGVVSPGEDYYWWEVSRSERRSQWLDLGM